MFRYRYSLKPLLCFTILNCIADDRGNQPEPDYTGYEVPAPFVRTASADALIQTEAVEREPLQPRGYSTTYANFPHPQPPRADFRRVTETPL